VHLDHAPLRPGQQPSPPDPLQPLRAGGNSFGDYLVLCDDVVLVELFIFLAGLLLAQNCHLLLHHVLFLLLRAPRVLNPAVLVCPLLARLSGGNTGVLRRKGGLAVCWSLRTLLLLTSPSASALLAAAMATAACSMLRREQNLSGVIVG